MSEDRAQALAAGYSALLDEMGGRVPAGQFVCPICLNLSPVGKATAAHYPAASLPGVHRRTLACEACNSFIGATYEPEGVDRLAGVRTFNWRFDGTRRVTHRGTLAREAPRKVAIRSSRRFESRGARRRGGLPAALDRARAVAVEPDVVRLEVLRPIEETATRALLAWAFLSWSHYARYVYTASAGAAVVRRLILRPESPLPDETTLSWAPLHPISVAEPIAVLRADDPDDITEWIGLGVDWGNGFTILPFADDPVGSCWSRVAELGVSAPHAAVRRAVIKKWEPQGWFRRLSDEIVIEGNGLRHAISERPNRDAAQLLAAGESPRRLEPDRGTWQRKRVLEHDVTVTAKDEFRRRR